MKELISLLATFGIIFTFGTSQATLLTFDDAITGATSYSFDGDGDSIDDVIFSTTDPFGFNTAGPGPNMSYINEPGLEGTTTLSPDLRVDFLIGAIGTLQFGFANSLGTGLLDGVTFNIFDSSNALLATTSVLSDFTLYNGVNRSAFPEALVSLDFSGMASYATFDFSNTSATRYILDNFEGTFGSTEVSVPEPTMLALLSIGLFGIGVTRRKKT